MLFCLEFTCNSQKGAIIDTISSNFWISRNDWNFRANFDCFTTFAPDSKFLWTKDYFIDVFLMQHSILNLTRIFSTYVDHILFMIFIGEELVISILQVQIQMFTWRQEEVEAQLVLLGWGQYVLQILDSGQMWTHTFTELTSKMDM